MRCSYVSILTTNDYLDGLLVLYHSLRATGTQYGFVVLITPDISLSTRAVLTAHSISYIAVDNVVNPTDIPTTHRWFATYSKLYVFGLAEYDKVVYLDADMLLLENIDHLFLLPHMSATNAGGQLPERAHWSHMNSGLFVAAPSRALLHDMLARIGTIECLTAGGTILKPLRGSDQDFVNAYYSDWRQRAELHLDHKYNMLHYCLDGYNANFGYTLTPGPKHVATVHFASYRKPWHLASSERAKLRCGLRPTLEQQALSLWSDTYDNAVRPVSTAAQRRRCSAERVSAEYRVNGT